MKSKIILFIASILYAFPSIAIGQFNIPDSVLQMDKYSMQIGSKASLDTFYIGGGELGNLPLKARFQKASINLLNNKIHLEFNLESSLDGEMLKDGYAIIGTVDSISRFKGNPDMLKINRKVVASPDSTGKFIFDCVVNEEDKLLVNSSAYFPRIYHIGKFINKKMD